MMLLTGSTSAVSEPRIPRVLADKLARFACQQVNFDMPVDLSKIAASLGVIEILDTELIEDGRTIWVDGKPRIELRADRPATRKRFTLAHEIGHILLERDQSVVRRTQGLDRNGVETLCDWTAASILMPRAWVQRYAERDHYNLSLLRLVAHRADVSLSAAAVRLAEVGGRTCILLRFQRAPKRWVVVGHAAVPTEYRGTIKIPRETSLLIDGLWNRRDTWLDVELTVGGRPLLAHAHLDRSGETCVALVTSLKP